ncbi:MAG: hypothetical protein A2487_06500 [Candidatus Raymondbacteria bacterium RifOxyC12_full_50_8]|uniref:Sodium/calcium exchanger membrane region domain-containing protein n=1 Tax=Candidatus Raymondbacteria bacterium RIFOXYD12_FULL_49_13 TaxID=1817890 RepID=A0A1F7FHX4_UNCRA|nr:MAG: hypothetical protein A2248_21215 [Candidatus Raymondbacteria bacterium RIFOXYA2_FULL_49_16]OGJ95686.1 MAG: hypothetical protein A2350_12155 [Candidatus Raymondbacteria bacterium RifOxyB12_full_50_8]OGK05951.1 MAG: hypothetical protein A2487_06500 [Candidatus Raymondbacteria bacterium RifOxyC12_full_50_8]OGK06309.1 MAG: hypothetical protein A2519_08530 [Candidatus Raymondbacteria bacterium RIFOXYD12_FULL_49_13]OGP40642.1 MAG: hypothetical protein A2324_03285 [Candidatus Raymondbacteria b
MVFPSFQFIIGLAILYFGADFFLKGAVRSARLFGVSPFIIGMTVVGFGTSAPELSVNLAAAFNGSFGLAMGNVVGSNIANIGLILGCAALIRPLPVERKILRLEVPVMIGVTLLLWFLAQSSVISRFNGLLFLAIFIGFFIYLYVSSKKTKDPDNTSDTNVSPLVIILQLAVGLGGLVFGAECMVRAAVTVASLLGISEQVIGVTVVAFGTSLPELASATVAAFRKEADIAVGTVVGSNIFNILLVLGATSIVHELPVTGSMLSFDMPIMALFALALFVIILWRNRISRIAGILLCAGYAAFVLRQVMQTQ